MSIINYLQLSKEISYALRHAPWEYELELDGDGWVSVEQLLISLKENSKWESVTIRDLEHIIQNSDKKRHELADNIPSKYIKVTS